MNEINCTPQTGNDVIISKNAEFRYPEFCEIGNHVAIDSGFYCSTSLEVKDYVHISPHVAVIGGRASKLTLGNFVFVSVGSKIVCASDEFFGEGLIGPIIPKQYKDNIINKPVIFENFSGCAANCTILPGSILREGVVVGANSMLKGDTEPWTIYIGSPAKPYKQRPKEKMIQYAKELGYDFYPNGWL